MAQYAPTYHIEREPVAGGTELVTVFGRSGDHDGQASDVPLLSVLKDTLGDNDSDNDRLRYVWILTSTRPTALQRAASAVSFAYFRPHTPQHADRVPKPILDLAAPSKTVWPNLLSDGLQAWQLDPMGMTIRTSTRAYRGNSDDYRKVQVFQALSALASLEPETGSNPPLSDADVKQLYSRLSLSDRVFGGLVKTQNLPRFYDKQATEREQTRGHNWELLRQRAESNGLYFEPLALPNKTPSEALLWISRADLERSGQQPFNGQFLNIANPWTDDRLLHWMGYSQTLYFDQERHPVDAASPESHPEEMIPLALYSLDHPRVPLLLVDFRNVSKPRQREMLRHGASTLITGVLGISRFGNWPFLAASSAWTFVRGRQGSAEKRSARLEAYAGARAFISADSSLDPELKKELSRRLDALAINPLENATNVETTLAREQYAALSQYAMSPFGLAAKIEADRRKELASYTRSRTQRLIVATGRFFTGGPGPDAATSVTVREQVDAYRKTAAQLNFLEQLLASSPQVDVNWSAVSVREAIDVLSAQAPASRRAPDLIAQVFEHSQDSVLRAACLRALGRFDTSEAHNALWRLAQDPLTGDSWRTMALLYLDGKAGAHETEASGLQSGAE